MTIMRNHGAQSKHGKTKYALVEHSPPIEVPSSFYQESSSSSTTDSTAPSKCNFRDELLTIYETYAALYPNPELSLENQERDRLLRAAQAADHAVQLNPPVPKKTRNSGWFFGLFAAEKKSTPVKNGNTTTDHNDVEADDARLKYTEQTTTSHQHDDTNDGAASQLLLADTCTVGRQGILSG